MNAKGKNKDAAFELMKWMSGKDAQKMRSESGTVLSAITEQLEEMKTKEVKDKPVIDMMQYAQKPVRLKGIEGQYFGDFFGKAIEKIFLGQASVADAMKEAAKLTDEKIAKEKK
jgi:multiple sugar transport system substrate-binding protein